MVMNNLLRSGKQFQTWRKYFGKCCASLAATQNTNLPSKDKPVSYDDFISGRQAQATRSIVVQVSSERSFNELYNYCNAYGNIVGAHHYRVQQEDDQHYILVEFASAAEAAAAIDASAYHEEMTGVPVRSPFLWFKAANGKRAAKTAQKQSADAALVVENANHTLSGVDLTNLLRTMPNIEAQIRMLHERTQLNDLGVRLRFLAALQMQQAVSGMFPAANAQPFGSSVNGFGKMGCDLDLILRFDREAVGEEAKRRFESRLVFHTKENLTNGRSQTQRQMESIGDMLHLFLPGVCNVRRILQARVPIIKYHHEHLDLEVDLSMSNLTGFYMSELLYMFGELDERVRPLTFCIRRWAQSCGLTNASPGRWISNFGLTCLVIFFLQQLKQPLLPNINTLMKSATPQDLRVTEDGINCTFGRDLVAIGAAHRSRNTSSIGELLLQFFEFYSQFDFNNRAISLNEGRSIGKPEHSALYIVNPLEQILNVSKNVSLEECERLRIEVRNAAWVLESEVENQSITAEEKQDSQWGLLNLFKNPEKAIIRPNLFFKPRMMEVSDLFDSGEADASKKAPPINFKNSQTRQQVHNIKVQARNDLKQMRMNGTTATAAAATGESTPKGRRSR